jgi:putative spermidine/putrescine transport system permease protein
MNARSSWLLLAPAAAVIGVLLIGGLVLSVSQSLGYLPLIGRRQASLGAYLQLLRGPGFWRSLLLTLSVSILSTLLTVVLAVLTALLLRRSFRGRGLVSFVYQLPLTIPHMVIAIGLLMLLSQSGLASRAAYHLGLITEPAGFPALVHDRLGVGIVLVYVWKQVPFVGLICLAVLQSIGRDYEEQARTLGAGRWQTLRHVLLPLLLPGLLPASIIIFAYVFGSFEVPFLLGKSYPSMLSVLAFRLYIDTDLAARPQAMAASVLITLLVLALTLAYRRLARRVSKP